MYVFTSLINCYSFVVEGAKLEIETTRIFGCWKHYFSHNLNTNVIGLEFVGIFGCCRHYSIISNTNVVGFKSAFVSTFSSISRLVVNKVPVALTSMLESKVKALDMPHFSKPFIINFGI